MAYDVGSINDYMNQGWGSSPWGSDSDPTSATSATAPSGSTSDGSGFDLGSLLNLGMQGYSAYEGGGFGGGGGGMGGMGGLGSLFGGGQSGGMKDLMGLFQGKGNSDGLTAGGVLGDTATGAEMGSMFGPWGTLIGSGVGLLTGLLSGGLGAAVPTGAKTQGASMGLEGSSNPLLQMLGSYIQQQGGGKGSNVLSNPAFAGKTNTFADILQWLSGQQLPGYKQMGTTGELAGIPPPQGAPYKKPVNIMGIQSPLQLQGELGFSPNLSPDQIQGLLPKIQQLLSGGGDIASLKGPLAQLVKGAGSAGTSAGATGANGPGGIAGLGLNLNGNLLGGNDELASILKAALQRGQQQPSTPSPWDQVRG